MEEPEGEKEPCQDKKERKNEQDKKKKKSRYIGRNP